MRNLVQELRDSNFHVKVTHYRRYLDWKRVRNTLVNPVNAEYLAKTDFMTPDIVELATYESPGLQYALPKGGTTCVEVTDPNGVTHREYAVCSEKDQFNRKLGTKIALNRILSRIS